ncbi:MAG: ABC transporter substrate-binding protein [Candidatus Sumerlaeaceae bacterium]|nr:ABC transporter substrate-binding protein [Candidatus Sumerlaeaceae bacterium]
MTGLWGCSSPAPESAASGSGASARSRPEIIRINVDPIARNLALTEQLAAEFTSATGTRIEIIKGPTDATERLSQYLQYLGAHSPDIDIYQIDVIWPGVLAEHLVDLAGAFDQERAEFFEPIVRNNTVDGRLVGIPWFADAGVLYYRTDLLEKYGLSVPKTWDELGAAARTIQEGERAAGTADFWGFVFQGKAYEGLTCNALEWIASSGGGTIVDADGGVSVNNEAAARAVSRMAGWVGTIAPPGVTTYQEEEARQLFQSGRVAFMRNWPYAYALTHSQDSPVHGKVGLAALPAGPGGRASALGGWQLAVSKYSRNPEAATEFVRLLTSREAQKRRALEASLLPSRPALYDDPEIATAIPFIPQMKEIFLNATPRPSAQTGARYNEVSTEFFQAVHRVLTGEQPPDVSLAAAERALKEVLGRP